MNIKNFFFNTFHRNLNNFSLTKMKNIQKKLREIGSFHLRSFLGID